jgi:hypothetical protein
MIDAAGSALRGTAWLAFRSAISPEHVHQRIVRFVAGIFVEWTRRPLHGQLAFPRLGERRRIVDLELIEERVDVEQAEALDEVEIPIPFEVAARVAVEAAAVVEVGRVHDQRVADSVSD